MIERLSVASFAPQRLAGFGLKVEPGCADVVQQALIESFQLPAQPGPFVHPPEYVIEQAGSGPQAAHKRVTRAARNGARDDGHSRFANEAFCIHDRFP